MKIQGDMVRTDGVRTDWAEAGDVLVILTDRRAAKIDRVKRVKEESGLMVSG